MSNEYTDENIDIRNYLRILRRRWIPATAVFGSVFVLTALATFLQKPVYEAEGKLLLKKQSGASISDLEIGGLGGLEALSTKSSPVQTEAEIIRSEPILRQTIIALKLVDDKDSPLETKDFMEALTVFNVKDTDVLNVTYKSIDPKESADVVNRLMDDYLKNNIETNRAEAASARVFIEKQVPEIAAKLRNLDLSLRRFKEANGIIALEEEAKVSVEVEGNFYQETAKMQSLLINARAKSRALRNKLGLSPQQGEDINALSQSTVVQQALANYQENERKLAEALKVFQPNHPTILDLQDRRTALKGVLGEQTSQIVETSQPQPLRNLQAGESRQSLTDALVQAEVDRLGLEKQVLSLAQTQAENKRRQGVIPKLEQQLIALERDRIVAQTTYEELLKALQQITISENQNIGNVRIIAAALEPKEPVSPRKAFNLAVGFFLGGLLGLGTALLLEALDTSVKTVQEAKELFDYTVLGNIPLLKDAEKMTRKGLDRPTPDLVVRESPRSSVSESYRMLQANLKFLSSDHHVQVFVVTSSIPKEGKSTVVANLALALGELGHRVLVIDADMRRPSQHQVWELPNTLGLSNVLVEQKDWHEAIRPEDDQLDILTAGVTPPNPVPLIDSHHMAVLLEEFHQAYDYVLIDSPPLAVAADALLLGKMTDGVLLVTRPGLVDSGSAQSAKDALVRSGQKVLGLVINGVIPENEPDSYYYYYAQDYYGENSGGEQSKAKKKKKKADVNAVERS